MTFAKINLDTGKVNLDPGIGAFRNSHHDVIVAHVQINGIQNSGLYNGCIIIWNAN